MRAAERLVAAWERDAPVGSAAQQAQSDQPVYQYFSGDVVGLVEANARAAGGYSPAVRLQH